MSLRFAPAISGAVLWAGRSSAVTRPRRAASPSTGDPSNLVSACTIGAACSGITMPFSIITLALTTNQIFIYSSGIVSPGAPLPLTASYGNVASLGHAFLAPGFEISARRRRLPTPRT